MLVLSRKVGEKLVIRNDIWVTVVEISGSRVRIGIDAPDDVLILRAELDQYQDVAVDADLGDEPMPNEKFDRHGDEIVRHAPASSPGERISGGRRLKSRGFAQAK